MKPLKDNFSEQSEVYKKYRPTYPSILYDAVLEHVECLDKAWDCGTGNGQVAKVLANKFNTVYATDISEAQLSQSFTSENIIYSRQRSESTSFENDMFDLVTVGQAVHWFDFKAFNTEVKRVLKPNGIIAIFGYGLLRINSEIDVIIDNFYANTIGPFWDRERQHIDKAYQTIEFDFKERQTPKDLKIETVWSLQELEGYLNSWSSVQRFIKKMVFNPVDNIINTISKQWPENEKLQVQLPLFIRIGKV